MSDERDSSTELMEAGDRGLSAVDWGIVPPEYLPRDMDELVEGWIACMDWHEVHGYRLKAPDQWASAAAIHLSHHCPNQCLAFIVGVLNRPINPDIRDVLAASTLEDLLSMHGDAVICEIERLTRESSVFLSALRYTRQLLMTDAIWQRVLVARGEKSSP